MKNLVILLTALSSLSASATFLDRGQNDRIQDALIAALVDKRLQCFEIHSSGERRRQYINISELSREIRKYSRILIDENYKQPVITLWREGTEAKRTLEFTTSPDFIELNSVTESYYSKEKIFINKGTILKPILEEAFKYELKQEIQCDILNK